ncbi:MAG: hypothetical protein IPO63_17130 [Bacteroidetes bacterium]|nr:hypothetical protein [Bacteroidota bacterium]
MLTVTDPVSGCTATDTANFYVSPTPVTPSIEFTGLDTTICISGTVSFSSIFVDGSLQWQSSSDNVSFFDIIGETGSTLTTGLLSSDTYIRLKAFCADSAYSNVKYVKVNNPQIVSTVNDTVCGQGNVTLEATANPGYFIRWYADSTLSGNYLANGSPYSNIRYTNRYLLGSCTC